MRREAGATPGLWSRARAWVWAALVLGVALVALYAYSIASRRSQPDRGRTYRVGYEENPPYHFRRPDGRVGGIAYDVVAEAARRTGIKLEWVECPESSEAALRSGRVDLWPVVTDLPERRQFIYISQPWMQTDHFLIVRDDASIPDSTTTGRLGHGRLRLHERLIAQHFPRAERVPFVSNAVMLRAVCAGHLTAAFLGAPQTIEALRAERPECAGMSLRIQSVPALRLKQGVGSTFGARPAADALRDAIADLGREGALSGTLIKYSFFSLDETSATYDVLVAQERAKWLWWGIGLLALALVFTLWLSRSLYRARQTAEAAKQRLVQSERLEAVGRLAGGVAHDFNNLLTAIFGYATAARRSAEDQGFVDPRDLEQIEQAANRAADLTQQLLALSRRQVLQLEVLHVDAVLREIEGLVRRLIGEHITVHVASRPELGCVRADKGQLTQVILNLCINARDAMPRGGTLSVETSNVKLDSEQAAQVNVSAGRYVLLEVVDTGEGMDAETRQRIFEPFFTTKAAGTGTGLGLATVYGIVAQSGGGISVTSERGGGSAFKVYLPQAECVAAVAVDQPAAAAPVTGTETVLMVEDEAGVSDIVARTLSDGGYRVLRAHDAEQALQMSSAHDGVIHLVLTDVVLPGMDGTELVARLKRSRPEAKVLYMSGYAENAVAVQNVLGNGQAFLPKPFTPELLLVRVRQTLDGRAQ